VDACQQPVGRFSLFQALVQACVPFLEVTRCAKTQAVGMC